MREEVRLRAGERFAAGQETAAVAVDQRASERAVARVALRRHGGVAVR